MLVELDRRPRAGRGASRRRRPELEAAVRDAEVRRIGGDRAAVDPDATTSRSRPPRLDRADRPQRPARLGDGLVPLRGRIAAPGDPATDVERQPPAVGDERPDEDATCAIAPSGPIQPSVPGVRTAARPARASPSSSIARIFGAPVMDPPGNAAASRSNASRPGREPAGDRGHEVLDGRRALEPAQPRHADRTGDGRRGRGRCAGRPRSSRSRRGPWRSPAARRKAPIVLGAVAAARPGALDRIGRDPAGSIDGQERLGRGRQDRPRAGVDPPDGDGPRSRYAANSAGLPVRSRGRAARDPRRRRSRAVGSGWPGTRRRARSPREPPRRRARRRAGPGSTGRRSPRSPASATEAAARAGGETITDVFQPAFEPSSRRRRLPGPPATPVRRGDPTRSPSRAARAAAGGAPGRPPRSPAGARARAPGRSRDSRRARRGTAARGPRRARGVAASRRARSARAPANGSAAARARRGPDRVGREIRPACRRPGRALSSSARPAQVAERLGGVHGWIASSSGSRSRWTRPAGRLAGRPGAARSAEASRSPPGDKASGRPGAGRRVARPASCRRCGSGSRHRHRDGPTRSGQRHHRRARRARRPPDDHPGRRAARRRRGPRADRRDGGRAA